MRFYLGGVPFGCDNIGDEAILAGAVEIVRRNFADAEIRVSTAKPSETSKRLGVETCGLVGFGLHDTDDDVRRALSGCDVFVWTGATGLSDYPETTLRIMRVAKELGMKTVVWGVGMNSQFNPAFYEVHGKKLLLCNILDGLTLGAFDFKKIARNILCKSVSKKVARGLASCDLIVVRDPQSAEQLRACGVENVNVGADSALIVNSPDESSLDRLSDGARSALASPSRKIGVCVSSQNSIAELDEFAKTLDELLSHGNRDIFFIPMNPITDYRLMRILRGKMKSAERAFLLEHCENPRTVATVASKCGAVISSRLHLLILAANVGAPIVGISRGSKVDNFLANFGMKSAGSVDDCNFALLKKQTEDLLVAPQSYIAAREKIYSVLLARLASAESLLRAALAQ